MESRTSLFRKAAATLAVLALFATLGWIVWLVSRRGPSVSITLDRPALLTVVALDKPVKVEGRLRNHKGPVTCNRVETHPDASGRFTVQVDPPKRQGLFTLHCMARNKAGRAFHFRFGRLAGLHVPLTRRIENAVVARVPLKILNEPGGLLSELQHLVGFDLTRRLNESLSTLKLTLPTIRIGPVSVERIALRGIESTHAGMIRFRLALRGICLHVGRGSADWKIFAARISLAVPRRGRLCLPVAIPMNVDLKLTPGQPVQVHAGPLTTDRLDKLAAFEPLLAGGLLVNGLSRRLSRALSWPSRTARSVLESLQKAHEALNARLTETTELLRPTPTRWGRAGVRVCMKVKLDRLEAVPEQDLASVHLSARIYGTTRKDGPCERENIKPLAAKPGHFRLALVPPAAPPATARLKSSAPTRTPRRSPAAKGRPSPPPSRPAWQRKHIPPMFRTGKAQPPVIPALRISLDLVNAYLAAMWAGKGLADVPVKMSSAKDEGFDVQRASFALPPAVFPESGEKLRLDAAELELLIRAKGEPRRLFRLNASVPLKLYLSTSGRLELNIVTPGLTTPSIRCIGELDGTPCAAQSRRYQDLVNVALELMKTGEVTVPDLGLEAALPVWKSDRVQVKAREVRLSGQALEVELAVEPR